MFAALAFPFSGEASNRHRADKIDLIGGQSRKYPLNFRKILGARKNFGTFFCKTADYC